MSVRFKLVGVFAVLALLLVACGGDDDSATTETEDAAAIAAPEEEPAADATTEEDPAEESTTEEEPAEEATTEAATEDVAPAETLDIAVGNSPTISNVSLALAVSEGIFADLGLNITPTAVTSGAQAVPLLLSGDLQFTAADPVGALTAVANGVPIQIAAVGNVGPPTVEEDTTALLVAGDAGLSEPADLAGATIATHALGSLAQLATAAAIDGNGGDSSQLQFVEVPIPQMVDAVSSGQVQGAIVNEPFTTQGVNAGLTNFLAPVAQSLPGVPLLVYITSVDFAESNPEAVNAFIDGLAQASAILAEDPERIIEVAATSTETDPAVLEQIKLPTFSAEPLDLDTLQDLMDVMVAYDVLEEPVDLDTAIFSAP